MEIQIKRAVKAGNSSAVILPRAWLNKEVRIELVKKTDETILSDVIDILKGHLLLRDVIGVYLTGSYARGEESENSDIDILVITKDIDREMTSEGVYNILIVSKALLEQKLSYDLLPVGQMIREAKPLLNSDYLDSVEVKISKNNIKWYLETTEDKIKLIEKIIKKVGKKGKKYLSGRIAYTLVLRIRTLLIIKKIIRNENYSKNEFVKVIKNISGMGAYEIYLSVKNNKTEKEIDINDAEKLCNYLKNELAEVKLLLKN